MAARSEVARLYRRACLSCLAWIWRKHIHRMSAFPWRLVSLADPRAPGALKDEICVAWDSAGACCVMPGIARRMKLLCIDGAQLLSPR